MTGRTRFVEDIDFLRAAFDFGLSVNDGIKELVDNSLDNNATSIWVQIIKREDGGIRLVVADDGDGIPQFFEDEGQREGIPYVMAFGGRGIEVESRKGRKRIKEAANPSSDRRDCVRAPGHRNSRSLEGEFGSETK